MPLALDDFHAFDFSTISFRSRLQLYWQTARGVSAIHSDQTGPSSRHGARPRSATRRSM
jgi:hypothetical protein